MDKIDILTVVEKFVSLKKIGAVYKGLCPLHNERSPSFIVHPAKNIYKCFGCGKGGDAIDFVMNANSMNFKESKAFIEEKFNYKFDEREMFYQTMNPVQEIKPDYIPSIDMIIENYFKGNLYNFLFSQFPDTSIADLFRKYKVYGKYDNWTLFWYIDIHGNIRSGKWMKYLTNGRRDKNSTTSWEHKKRDINGEKYPDFVFSQCFFGEHILSEDVRKPVAIVESEKTALIASIFIDKYIWIACGSKNGLIRQKCEVLANRSVTLFPDLGAYDLWSEKAKEFNFNISDHLEKIATYEQREAGYDLADFLLQ